MNAYRQLLMAEALALSRLFRSRDTFCTLHLFLCLQFRANTPIFDTSQVHVHFSEDDTQLYEISLEN